MDIDAWGWIIGTAILWVLKFVSIPFAKLLAGDKMKKVEVPDFALTTDVNMPAGENTQSDISPIPMPVQETVESFKMPIKQIFSMRGHDTAAVTGLIERGVIHAGDPVEIMELQGKRINAVVTEVRKVLNARKFEIVNEGRAGDKVSLALQGIELEKGKLKAEGSVLATPGSIPLKVEEQVPTGFYILADVIVLGIAGGLLGMFTGYYFIGFALKPRDWPGMMVFILASLVGSLLHG